MKYAERDRDLELATTVLRIRRHVQIVAVSLNSSWVLLVTFDCCQLLSRSNPRVTSSTTGAAQASLARCRL